MSRSPPSWPLWVAVALVGGCSHKDGLSKRDRAVTVSPSADFGQGYLGDVFSATVTVQSVASGRVIVSGATFTAESLTVTPVPRDTVLQGYATLELHLAWTPAVAGALDARLQLDIDDVAYDTWLTGEALAIPTCDDADPCTDNHFDRASASCQRTYSEAPCDDGSACTEDDRCSLGQCRGAAVTCDDDNVCTRDLCDPLTGCVALPSAIICDDGDPCTRERCDPHDGCESAGDADNGTPCGSFDCAVGHVCFFGDCHALDVSDFSQGLACSDGNVCTRDDHCDGGECVAGPTRSEPEVVGRLPLANANYRNTLASDGYRFLQVGFDVEGQHRIISAVRDSTDPNFLRVVAELSLGGTSDVNPVFATLIPPVAVGNGRFVVHDPHHLWLIDLSEPTAPAILDTLPTFVPTPSGATAWLDVTGLVAVPGGIVVAPGLYFRAGDDWVGDGAPGLYFVPTNAAGYGPVVEIEPLVQNCSGPTTMVSSGPFIAFENGCEAVEWRHIQADGRVSETAHLDDLAHTWGDYGSEAFAIDAEDGHNLVIVDRQHDLSRIKLTPDAACAASPCSNDPSLLGIYHLRDQRPASVGFSVAYGALLRGTSLWVALEPLGVLRYDLAAPDVHASERVIMAAPPQALSLGVSMDGVLGLAGGKVAFAFDLASDGPTRIRFSGDVTPTVLWPVNSNEVGIASSESHGTLDLGSVTFTRWQTDQTPGLRLAWNDAGDVQVLPSAYPPHEEALCTSSSAFDLYDAGDADATPDAALCVPTSGFPTFYATPFPVLRPFFGVNGALFLTKGFSPDESPTPSLVLSRWELTGAEPNEPASQLIEFPPGGNYLSRVTTRPADDGSAFVVIGPARDEGSSAALIDSATLDELSRTTLLASDNGVLNGDFSFAISEAPDGASHWLITGRHHSVALSQLAGGDATLLGEVMLDNSSRPVVFTMSNRRAFIVYWQLESSTDETGASVTTPFARLAQIDFDGTGAMHESQLAEPVPGVISMLDTGDYAVALSGTAVVVIAPACE